MPINGERIIKRICLHMKFEAAAPKFELAVGSNTKGSVSSPPPFGIEGFPWRGFMKKIVIATCVLLSLTGTTAQASGDPALGKEKSVMCGACHGQDGNSAVPTFPKLSGQAESYLMKQLKDFKAGTRKDPMMSAQAATLTDADISNLAAYFSSQTGTPDAVADANLAARGQKLFLGGDTTNEVPACAACHGPTGAGNPAAGFPALSGQHALYVTTQLQRFKSGERTNDPAQMMVNSVARMSDSEMKALAEYISGLH